MSACSPESATRSRRSSSPSPPPARWSWKEQLAGFSLGLSAAELRAAILLAVLAFVVYPILPRTALDPWGLVQPRAAWVTVILIAAIGFGNYILFKAFGARGVQITGFL